MVKHTLILLLLCSGLQAIQKHTPKNDVNVFYGLMNEWNVDWKRVYLATFPRSGNHWVRYLIEEASGIATSSIYLDQVPPHMPINFPWNGYCPKLGYEGNRRYPTKIDTVVIKTHSFKNTDHQNYIAAIRIIRNPIDSIYSNFALNKQKNEKNISRDFLLSSIQEWKKFQTYWDSQPNVITFRYEDLLEDPFSILKSILQLCNYTCDDKDILRAITKYPPKGDALKHINHYTQDDLRLINEKLNFYMRKYSYEIPH